MLQLVPSQPAYVQYASSQPAPTIAELTRRLQAIAAVPIGDVGISVFDLTTGQRVSVNGTRPFPMASTVKVAIAATYMAEVDAGRRTLADMIPVSDRLRLRSDGISAFAPHSGVTLSAMNLIELMLTRSDNSATDVLLANLGGPTTVDAWLKLNRVEGLRVDRTIAQLLVDRRGARVASGSTAAETLRRWDPITPGSVGEVESDDAASAQPALAFDRDPRDTATPDAYADFLRRLYKGELVKPASRDFLFDVMRRCITGANRIKGLLPAGTTVEHKTGTFSTITDDVGFMTMPDGHRVIVTVFARGGSKRAAIIARAARSVYDAFAAIPAPFTLH